MNLQNPRLVLMLIVLLFIAPLLLAVLMRSEWWDFRPASFSNRGILVQPPVKMNISAFDVRHTDAKAQASRRPQWTVLYPIPEHCGRDCRKAVSGLRQLHIATGRNRDRVTVLLLADRDLTQGIARDMANIYPGFTIAVDTSGSVAATLPPLPDADQASAAFGDGRGFLLDPPGNIILGYPPGFDPNHVNKDLKRLLTWSVQDKKP